MKDAPVPAKEEKKEIALPDVSFAGFGATEITPEDVKTPRITVLNGMSDAVAEGLGVPGDFYNTGIKRSLGKKIQFIPLGVFVNRVMLVDRDLVCRSLDRVHGDPGGIDRDGKPTTVCGECTYSKWKPGRMPPECDVTYNYPVVLIDEKTLRPSMGYLSFRSTSADVAKQLNGDHEADGKPWFAYKYQAEPLMRKNEKGSWYVMKVQRMGEASLAEQGYAYEQAIALSQSRPEDVMDITGDES